MAVALAGRLVLALGVFPGEGFGFDLQEFQRWATEMLTVGPSKIYASDPLINYPPGYLEVLWALGGLSRAAHNTIGTGYTDTLAMLLKIPAILADVGTGWLVYLLASRLRGHLAGMLAASVVLFLPLTWYDSAVWGQVDAVSGFFMVASLALLICQHDIGACVVAAGAILMKPQAVIVIVVVVAVLLRRHLVQRQRPWVLAAGPAAGLATVTLVALPFDIGIFAPEVFKSVPVLSQAGGLYGLFQGATKGATVLSANAYNGWVMVGPRPLDQRAGGFDLSAWTPDSIPVLWGISAFAMGALLLAATTLLVAGGLLTRDDDVTILLGFTLLAVAFFAEPTRVHERYMFPAYLTGAVLTGGGLARASMYLVSNVLTTVNMHGVLGTGFGEISGRGVGQPSPGNRVIVSQPPGAGFGSHLSGATPSGQPGGGIGSPSGSLAGGTGGPSGASSTGSVLPWSSFGRAPWLVDMIAVAQTVTLVILIAAWLVHLRRRPAQQRPTRSGLTRSDPLLGHQAGPGGSAAASARCQHTCHRESGWPAIRAPRGARVGSA